jgi:hypothetical protein
MPRKPKEPLILYEGSFVRAEVDRLLDETTQAHLKILYDALWRFEEQLNVWVTKVTAHEQAQHACITQLKARIRELERQLEGIGEK